MDVTHNLVLALLLLGAAGQTMAAATETKLLRYPDISKTHVVFAYAGDLWTAPRAGGEATRLTAHPGDEVFPKFSPDGKWIAFTGEYDGNSDVYVIPSAGGEPRRLTFHPGNDMVLGWTPDGKRILFRSDRLGPFVARLFTVSVDGGEAEALPMMRGSLGSYSPDGKRIAYTPTSVEFRTWKRYKGGWATHIDLFDLNNKSYEALPKNEYSDIFPMWYGNAIYFASDREGVMNLFKYDLGTKRAAKLTAHGEYDVKWPSLGAGSDAIVYENGGVLFAYDLKKGGQPHQIPVTVNTDAILARAEIKPLGSQIREFSLSPSGVRALFSARGEIFTVPVENGSTRNLTETAGIHEHSPAWSPDGKWVAYHSDRSGEYEIYLRPQKGGDEVRITTDGGAYRFGLDWSPDSKKLMYTDKKLRLWYVDIDEKKPVLVETAEYANAFQGANWSPDSKWIAYAKEPKGANSVIYVYSLETKQSAAVTDEFYNSFNPAFDGNGKYLYFLSQRHFYPSGSTYEPRFSYYNTTSILALTLKADEASPFGPQSDDEKVADEKKSDEKKGGEEKKEEAKKDEGKKDEGKKDEKKAAGVVVKVDFDGIIQRVTPVPIRPGNYFDLQARKDKIFYRNRPFESFQMGVPGPRGPMSTLYLYDIVKREQKTLLDGISGYDLDKEGKKLIYRARNTFGVIDAAPGKKVGDGALKLDGVQATVDPRAEWKQILHEAWRIERDFYYDPNMGGLDWDRIGKRYEALLPWAAHRSDVNYLIGEMIAELSTSHAYVGGGDTPDVKRVPVGLLGVDFVADSGYFKIGKIYRGENWEENFRGPLAEPGLKIKEGNYILAVNGLPARAPADPYSYYQGLAGKLVTLKVNDKPSGEGAWEISVKPVGSERNLRYLDWIEGNRRYVSQATGGRVAYMHVPNTSIEGLIMFDKYLNGQTDKEALIVDERYNGGGMLPDFFTEKLARKPLNGISPREGKDIKYPSFAITGPKVMLVNEMAGSGGDLFPFYFKQAKIGPVIGARTWGGLIGISRSIPMLDSGNVTAPEFGIWSYDERDWVAENHGIDPDVPVEQRPDLEAKGQDPQLDKAIELIKAALAKEKPLPQRPKYPPKVYTQTPKGANTGGQ